MNILTLATTVALTGALVSTGSIAASADEAPVTTTQECNFGAHLVRVWLHMPAEHRGDRSAQRRIRVLANMPTELRVDLRELREADPEERRALAEAIAENALDGEYGPKAQTVAERIRDSEAWQSCVVDEGD